MNRSHPPIFDLQINGWRGVDFNADQLSADQLHQVCLDLAERGVQRFLATLITDELPLMLQRIRRLNHLAATDPLAGKLIAGIHLEGPFLNP
ncbi:MAG: N-acetylglucosamine-6-phosphate deacetylase, partial [Planctomycetota bacterium]